MLETSSSTQYHGKVEVSFPSQFSKHSKVVIRETKQNNCFLCTGHILELAKIESRWGKGDKQEMVFFFLTSSKINCVKEPRLPLHGFHSSITASQNWWAPQVYITRLCSRRFPLKRHVGIKARNFVFPDVLVPSA